MTPHQRPAPAGGIGSSIRRHEDPPLLAGRARYVADVRLPRMLTMAVVRSPVAHGTLRSIDCSEARRLPGVEAVLTAEEVGESLGGIPRIPPRVSFDETVIPYLQPVIAHDRVRYVGEPMAVVVAQDRYVAEDAAELVFADIDHRPVMLDAGAEDRPGQRLFDAGKPGHHPRSPFRRHGAGIRGGRGGGRGRTGYRPPQRRAHGDAGHSGRVRPGRRTAHRPWSDQGAALEPGNHRRTPGHASRSSAHARDGGGGRLRRAGRAVPRGCAGGVGSRPAGSIRGLDRGPQGTPPGGQPLPPAAPSGAHSR